MSAGTVALRAGLLAVSDADAVGPVTVAAGLSLAGGAVMPLPRASRPLWRCGCGCSGIGGVAGGCSADGGLFGRAAGWYALCGLLGSLGLGLCLGAPLGGWRAAGAVAEQSRVTVVLSAVTCAVAGARLPRVALALSPRPPAPARRRARLPGKR